MLISLRQLLLSRQLCPVLEQRFLNVQSNVQALTSNGLKRNLVTLMSSYYRCDTSREQRFLLKSVAAFKDSWTRNFHLGISNFKTSEHADGKYGG